MTWLLHRHETDRVGVVLEEGLTRVWAMTWNANPLEAPAEDSVEALLDAWDDRSARAIVWSGSGAASLFERDPASWTPAARERFEAWLEAAEAGLAGTHRRILFRPHARHVLGDPQTCLTFLRERAGERFGIVLDAPALLEPEMLDRAEAHLTRAFDALGGRADGVWLRARRTGMEDETGGEVDPRLLMDLVERYTPAETPRIIEEGEAAPLGGPEAGG